MNGWLLDTNVVASLVSSTGAPSVKVWAAARPEERLFLSIVTIPEYDKGIHFLEEDDPNRVRHIAARDGIAARFAPRILPVSDAVIRRWGLISGVHKRRNGHPPAVIDTILAATAIEHRLVLVTRNIRGVRESGAAILDPWSGESVVSRV